MLRGVWKERSILTTEQWTNTATRPVFNNNSKTSCRDACFQSGAVPATKECTRRGIIFVVSGWLVPEHA